MVLLRRRILEGDVTEQWKIERRVQYEMWHSDRRLDNWPLQDTPQIGDLVTLPSGRYSVIRRTWDLTVAGLTRLRIDLQPVPPPGGRRGTIRGTS